MTRIDVKIQRVYKGGEMQLTVGSKHPTLPTQQACDGLLLTVRNDGKGIPVSKHKTENAYLPQLVFGSLLTGSNFNDHQVWVKV